MIQTERLCLRPPEMDDLEALHEVFSDPRAMRFWSHAAHEGPDRTAETLEKMIASYQETGLEYVITLSGTVIGKAGMWRRGEVGYVLHPQWWGKGYAREAMAAVIAAAFARDPSLEALRAEIDPRNTGSAGLLMRLGFREVERREKHVEIAGEWCDSAFWQLDRPRFPAADPTCPAARER